MADAEEQRKLPLAKRMRSSPVATEQLLWGLLRDRRLAGLKFRRQVPIGRYVVDFVCFRHRLIVEADGPFHAESQTDVERDAWLVGQGFRVLRFRNAEVFTARDSVITVVLEAAGRD